MLIWVIRADESNWENSLAAKGLGPGWGDYARLGVINTNVLDDSETRVGNQRHLMLSLYIQVIGQVKDRGFQVDFKVIVQGDESCESDKGQADNYIASPLICEWKLNKG